jgi:hypothetical protein
MTALLASGISLEEPGLHANGIYRMVKLDLGIEEDEGAPVEKAAEAMPSLETVG